jgi:hypothetical protein
MLDLLSDWLDTDALNILNLSVAKFESPEGRGERGLRPAVRAVRFEGQHILSSAQACQLLVDVRALVDVSFFLRWQPTPDRSHVLPVRVALQQDHVTILTGFGTERPRIANDLQRELVKRVLQALERGPRDISELEALARRISKRAQVEGGVEPADILAAPEDWAESED